MTDLKQPQGQKVWTPLVEVVQNAVAELLAGANGLGFTARDLSDRMRTVADNLWQAIEGTPGPAPQPQPHTEGLVEVEAWRSLPKLPLSPSDTMAIQVAMVWQARGDRMAAALTKLTQENERLKDENGKMSRDENDVYKMNMQYQQEFSKLTARAEAAEQRATQAEARFKGITDEWGKQLKLETMETLLNGGSPGAERVAELVCAWDNERKRAEKAEPVIQAAQKWKAAIGYALSPEAKALSDAVSTYSTSPQGESQS